LSRRYEGTRLAKLLPSSIDLVPSDVRFTSDPGKMRRPRVRFSFASALPELPARLGGGRVALACQQEAVGVPLVGRSLVLLLEGTELPFNAACGSGGGGEKLLTAMERSLQGWIPHRSAQVLCWVPLRKACSLGGRAEGLPATRKHLEALLDGSHIESRMAG
jgi:hypothetical protein